MRFIWQHIQDIISGYDGSLPLSIFLKGYYKKHPKLGSRDRKMLSEMAFTWYRSSKAVSKDLSFEEQLTTCMKLCNTENKHLLRLTENIPADTDNINLPAIFPHNIKLSEGISEEEWLQSMLVQPMLFIRVRQNKDLVIETLEEQAIPYRFISEDCVAMPNGTAIDRWIPEFAYVVQDASSQQTGDYLDIEPYQECWDSCCGAGGKSLLLKDKQPLAELTVSDSRKTILNNLKERFRTYSHIMPTAYRVDVANKTMLQDVMPDKQYDHIICDVPCTGSGTWARTPEQMFYFKAKELEQYVERQKQIAVNAAAYLKPGGKLYYITCSVFKEENEAVADHIIKETQLKAEHSELIKGIEIQADSMYIAVLSKDA